MEIELFKNLPSLRLCYNHGIITRQTGEGGNTRYFTNLPLTYVGQFNHRFINGSSSFTRTRGVITIPYEVNNGFVATACLPEEQEYMAPLPIMRPRIQLPGVAMEIHNAFDKIDMGKYMAIINIVISDANIAQYKRDIIGYIKRKFTEKINELPFTDKLIKLQELETILIKLSASDLIHSERKRLQIGKTVDYVLLQSPVFIEFYITAFIQDCAHAYTGTYGLSCTKGIVERFIILIGQTLETTCRETTCTRDQLDLLKLFINIDINDLLSAWSKRWEDKTEVWQSLKPKERIKDFKEFIEQKYREAGLYTIDIKKLIDKTVTENAEVFTRDDGVYFGGFTKRKHKHKRTHKRTHKHKRKHKRTKRK
jgi:hypothetical protein